MSAVGSIGVTSLGANVAVGPTIVKVTYVIVAGGGSGGTGAFTGGGGAGGVLRGCVSVIKGTVLTIPIGGGGSAVPVPTLGTTPASAGMGGPSQIVWVGNTLQACGGGYGAQSGLAPSPCFPARLGHPGGSGGGNGSIGSITSPRIRGLGVPGQGYPGGGTNCNSCGPGFGGGGGAGGAGTSLPGGNYTNPGHTPTGPKAGCGGPGIAVLIKGPTSPITLAGGGGAGGLYQSPYFAPLGGYGYQGGCGGAGGGGTGFKTPSGSPPGTGGTSGSPNTGGGGGGGGYHNDYPPTPVTVSYIGGNGGSGTVIISVPTPLKGTASGTFTCGPDGTGNTWFQFTSASSYTV